MQGEKAYHSPGDTECRVIPPHTSLSNFSMVFARAAKSGVPTKRWTMSPRRLTKKLVGVASMPPHARATEPVLSMTTSKGSCRLSL